MLTHAHYEDIKETFITFSKLLKSLADSGRANVSQNPRKGVDH